MNNRRLVSILSALVIMLATVMPLSAKSADGLQRHLAKISNALAVPDGQAIRFDVIANSADYIGKHLPAALANAVVTEGDQGSSVTSNALAAAKDHTGGEIMSAISADPEPLQLSSEQAKALIKAYGVYSKALVKAANSGSSGTDRLKAAANGLRLYLSGLDKLLQLEPGSAELNQSVSGLVDAAANFHG